MIPTASRPCRAEAPARSPEAVDAVVAGMLDLAVDSAPAVAAHMERTARLARALVRDLDLPDPLARVTVLTARLHDIGKLRIPPWVLEKPGPLSEFECHVMRTHSVLGQEMLERRAELAPLAPLVRATHERWDGTGYPDRLGGSGIPLPARVVAVCDAFDAMTKPRVYSASVPIATALEELDRCSGTQFDPGVVTAFTSLFESRFDRWAKRA